ncbi:MAG TPA: glycosyltransferase [Deltaproteobacteria bacterium]|nr:glycosyltransferase [Deltaproteobacteria bacterium]
MKESVCILQVSTYDIRGGAAQVAWNLHQAYRQRGLESWMAVGKKLSDDPNVLIIPNEQTKSLLTRALLRLALSLRQLNGYIWGMRYIAGGLRRLAEPRRHWDIYRGVEDFHYPGSWGLLQITPEPPDIVHCHNLHGGYFDLRVLPWLSHRVPVVLTLHDAWLLSGHCAHSLDCERWRSGCGQCPDLDLYPPIRRDATAYNWRRKKDIFARSRLYVATPSRWLMRKVEQSILASAIEEARVISNGVDIKVFRPADKRAARAALDIPQDAKVLLFVANGIRPNMWKDYQTMRAAVALVAERYTGDLIFIALGEEGPPEYIGQAEIRFVPYQRDSAIVAQYYQAADLYVHAAKVDTFPNTVLEALACGTPVVATAVGGIPEQIEDGVTGFLVPPGDPQAMADRILKLLTDQELRRRIAHRAAEVARERFDLDRQVKDYISWYDEILGKWKRIDKG